MADGKSHAAALRNVKRIAGEWIETAKELRLGSPPAARPIAVRMNDTV